MCLFTGTVYWGVLLPPSMLIAKAAAIFSAARLAETCSKGTDEHRFGLSDAHTSGFPRPLLQI